MLRLHRTAAPVGLPGTGMPATAPLAPPCGAAPAPPPPPALPYERPEPLSRLRATWVRTARGLEMRWLVAGD